MTEKKAAPAAENARSVIPKFWVLNDFFDGGREERSLKFVSSLFISIEVRSIFSEAIPTNFGFALNPYSTTFFSLYDSMVNDDSNGYVFFINSN